MHAIVSWAPISYASSVLFDSTVLALTLSIFLLALATGVSKMTVACEKILTNSSHSSSVLFRRSMVEHGYVCSRTAIYFD